MAKNCEKVKTVNAYIVEDHHEVVPVIHRAIGSKVLPFQDISLVHFDSHPDLLIPIDMAADQVFIKDDLYRTLSIENWIIPLVYAGHIGDIFWIKPPWAKQIPDSYINFKVGKCKKTGTIRTTCKENYFISELLYSREENLDDIKSVTLTILTLIPESWKNSDQNNSSQNKTHYQATPQFDYLMKKLKEKKFILDIDLDFYSTKNPFKDVYSKTQYELLKQLYTCSPIQNISDQGVECFVKERKQQLDDIKKLLFSDAESFDSSIKQQNNKRAILVKELLEDLESTNKDYDKNLVHEAGCTIDDSELPHHISTTQEIIQLVQITKDLLESLASRPSLITIARSSEDDYCPPDQVDYIEESICMIMEECYVYVNINRLYENETSD
ncbi:hypothetical protein LOTGIDRAFT_219799 [Lottia gigantea]|uniref:Uncharacterized protein n=1 Tax=Lottia gigantea TaxID=225164 RepID=V3ZU80_LOTGI|nr:hypothetical protein LOTGIDRAFT_219799 [Lottia gigantea]ESO87912.1 hypothetical protein LOTGIDRAFT_219799 [Lottia gigantea]